jgi:transcriptional regulator with XRE-family HTH domain
MVATGILRLTFGQACLRARLDLDLTQQQIADRVGLTRSYIAKIERGSANPTFEIADRIADALGLDLVLQARGPIFPAGPAIRDALHARCSAYVDRRLQAIGWTTAREVEIVHGRSHGWIDILAFDRRTGTLLIVEIKTRLNDIGALERQVGWYERAACGAAHRQGWRASKVASSVLVLATREADAVLREHRALLSVAFASRARELASWLVDPAAAPSGARAIALIDPSGRRREWLIRASVDGRRSRLPYVTSADAVNRPHLRRIAQ